jgi:hypothetical protein
LRTMRSSVVVQIIRLPYMGQVSSEGGSGATPFVVAPNSNTFHYVAQGLD